MRTLHCRRTAAPLLSILMALPLLAIATTGSPAAGAANNKGSKQSDPSGPTSILQLGDSIASGEGTLYNFTFDTKTGQWNGPGDPNPKWEGDYPQCHQSPDAYGAVLAKSYKGATFTQLACTGATFGAGVAGPWSATVPPQFGDWATKSGLNEVYTKAKPDLVLVTLGADDVQFVNVVTQCVEASFTSHTTPCTASSPAGPDDVVTKDFTNYLPTLEATLQTLAAWILARGKQLGVVPKIVFTTYPNPLPSDAPAGGKDYCPDTWLLYNDQVNYFSSLVPILDKSIASAITTYAQDTGNTKNVSVVNLVNAFDGHQWCAKKSGTYVTPDAYGFSIYKHYSDLVNPNPAAFHPTPDGQQVIANQVQSAIGKLFN